MTETVAQVVASLPLWAKRAQRSSALGVRRDQVTSDQLASEYGFTDVDGRQVPAFELDEG